MDTYHEALSAYLARDENREIVLAEQVGRTQASINRYRNGKRFPDAITARLIDDATGGEVPFSAWQAALMAKHGIEGKAA